QESLTLSLSKYEGSDGCLPKDCSSTRFCSSGILSDTSRSLCQNPDPSHTCFLHWYGRSRSGASTHGKARTGWLGRALLRILYGLLCSIYRVETRRQDPSRRTSSTGVASLCGALYAAFSKGVFRRQSSR